LEVKNYNDYFNIVYDHLENNGLALIHTIGRQSNITNAQATSDFIDKYIFPGVYVPCWEELSPIVSRKFFIQDWHNLDNIIIKLY
jgi:Cyclopropane fatty acid synthase and related methyltransferases